MLYVLLLGLLAIVGVFGLSIAYRYLKTDIPIEVAQKANQEISNEDIKIAVFNGCGVAGIAEKARKFMLDKGFDVAEVGNYSQKQDRTIVIDYVGDTTSCNRIAKVCGINKSQIIKKIDTTRYLKAAIVLGDDYNLLLPFKNK